MYGSIKRKARKEHRCTLCFEPIAKGTEYLYERVTPWLHPDNDGFSDYKVHKKCDKIFMKVGPDFDMFFPSDKSDWADMKDWL